MLYDPRRSNVAKIEREAGIKFERVSAPQPDEIAKAMGGDAAEMITDVSDSVIPAFKSAAEELLKNSGLSAVELLAKALAKAVGYTDVKKRSLLTSMENYVTLLLEGGKPMFTPSFAFGTLRRFVPEDKVDAVQGLALTADGQGAVFDVPAKDLDVFLNSQKNAVNVSLKIVKELPSLQQREDNRPSRYGGGRGFSGGRNGGYRFGGRSGGGGGRGFGGGRGGGKRW
jgi:ATP-dependent RNA helicase DDX21